MSARYYKDGSEILINQSGLEPAYLEENKQFAIQKNLDRESYAKGCVDRYRLENPTATSTQIIEEIKRAEQEFDDKCGRYAHQFDALFRTPRRLTPKECARLMGFEKPEFDRSEADRDFRIVCADASAYKQFGNSVVVPVFRAVAKLLQPHLKAIGDSGKNLHS